ncbi:mucin-5AC [Ixodes scapularis]
MSPVKNAYFDRSCQSSFTSDHARKSQLDWAPPTTRRYPIQQERYSVGSYPTICLTKSPLPVARPFTSPEVIAPVKVKILPLASSPRLTSSFSQQRTTCGDIDKQDPCSTESVIQALKERRKRAAAAAYRDSLEAAELGMPAHSSKRSRRDSVCAMGPPMPSFMPVATSVGGLGPPFHAPSSPKRAVEGAFKRARLPSTAGASLSKRQRNNAISMSYCSSKAVLETSQLQKRKAAAAARDTPPRSKLARNEDRSSDADSTAEKAEDSAGEGALSIPADRSTPDTSKSDGRTSGPRRDALPSDQSVRKKRLVFPEHVATLEEHESDRARDRQRLNKMLGSVRDVYQSSQGQAAVISSQANAGNSIGATTSFSLPAFSIASTTTSVTTGQESTKAVSVISSPLMSVSSAPSTKQLGVTLAEKTSPEGDAAAAATSSTTQPQLLKVPSTTEAPKTNPLLGSPLSIITTSVTAALLKLPASVPILATGTATNPLLRGLSAPTASSPSHTPAKLELPAPITSFAPAASFDSSSNPLLSKASSHGRLDATATAATSIATFGAPTFKVNGPSTAEIGTSFSSFPSSSLAPGATGSSPFKLGAPSMPMTTTVAATTAASSISLPSFRPPVQTPGLPMLPAATATTLQQSGGSGFAFGGSLATSTAPVALSFGPAASSSSGTAPFKFGAPPTQSVPGATRQPPVPTLSTATAPSASSPFAFGTPPTTTKAEPIAAPFAFGKSSASSPANTRPSFGVPTAASFVLGSSLTSFQPPPPTPLFPSASSVSRPSDSTAPTASQSGIQFGAPVASQPSSGATTTASQVCFQFGTQSTSASQPSGGTAATVSQVGFQFGTRATSASQPSSGTTTTASQSGFHFGTQATSASQASSGATTTASQSGFQFGTQATSASQPSSGATVPGSQGGFQFGTHATRANQPSGGAAGLARSQGGFQFGTHASTPSQPLSGATTATSQGGFQFGAQQPGFGFAATNGLANGVSSSGAGSQSTGVFKFGGSVAPPVGAPPSFNFVASQCGPSLASNPAFNFELYIFTAEQVQDSRLREAGAEVVYCLARGAPKGPNLPRARLNHQDALFPGHGKATHSQTWAGEPAWLGVRGDATLQTPAFTGAPCGDLATSQAGARLETRAARHNRRHERTPAELQQPAMDLCSLRLTRI